MSTAWVAAVRTLLAGAAVAAYALAAGPPALLLARLRRSPRPLFRVGAAGARLGLCLAGVRVRVRGRERLRPGATYLFMPNHQSNLDPPAVFLALGREVRMLAKAQLFRLPLLGPAMRLAGFVPVVREDRERAIEAVDRAAAWLRRGRDFVVFPEGTRSPDGRLLPLKKGPFVMAIKGGAPVVPVAVRGSGARMPKGSWLIRGGTLEVEVLEPIATAGLRLEDRERLRARVGRVLAAALASPPPAVAGPEAAPVTSA